MNVPEFYEIRVKGSLQKHWVSWFEGLEIHHETDDETVLSGLVVDQAALHGILMKIRDLGLPLVAVKRVDDRNQGRIARSKEY
jgi:hypothetical protein